MNFNQRNDCWAELKCQAKRQMQEPATEVAELAVIKQFRPERESLKSIMTIKTRAERQLLELQDLLQIMENFQSADVSATHKV